MMGRRSSGSRLLLLLTSVLLLKITLGSTASSSGGGGGGRGSCRWDVHDPQVPVPTCPPPQRGSACHCIFNNNTNPSRARCCHVDLRRLNDEITSCRPPEFRVPDSLDGLFLSNVTGDNDELNLFALTTWLPKKVRTLVLNDGGYNSVKEIPAANWTGLFNNLKCLNLSRNHIANTKAITEFVNGVPSLNIVDLSYNNLTLSPELNARGSNKLSLNLAGNPHLKCDGIRDLTKNNITFIDMTETSCYAITNFEWFNSTDPINLLQFEARIKIMEDCPKSCTCTTGRLIYLNGISYYSATVDCGERGLTAMPAKLPPMTYFLNISHNSITSLEPLVKKKGNYENVRLLYADYNNISSIQVLEGSDFLQRFEIFSLRNNNLQSLTIHILNNIFEKNWHTVAMNLGNNYFKCDCSTYHYLKTWLIRNKRAIPDHEEIFCQGSMQQILQLKDTDVCLAPEEWTSKIYYLIGAEVALLLLLIFKVSYDYWVFKKAGYLPWPASKMPKLPCDCVLET